MPSPPVTPAKFPPFRISRKPALTGPVVYNSTFNEASAVALVEPRNSPGGTAFAAPDTVLLNEFPTTEYVTDAVALAYPSPGPKPKLPTVQLDELEMLVVGCPWPARPQETLVWIEAPLAEPAKIGTSRNRPVLKKPSGR